MATNTDLVAHEAATAEDILIRFKNAGVVGHGFYMANDTNLIAPLTAEDALIPCKKPEVVENIICMGMANNTDFSSYCRGHRQGTLN